MFCHCKPEKVMEPLKTETVYAEKKLLIGYHIRWWSNYY